MKELQLAEAVRIQRALAVFSVVAWRLLALTYAQYRGIRHGGGLHPRQNEWAAAKHGARHA